MESQRATCKNCGRAIVWHFDWDDGDEAREFGFWYDAETTKEVCGGPTGNPIDDLWHEPT